MGDPLEAVSSGRHAVVMLGQRQPLGTVQELERACASVLRSCLIQRKRPDERLAEADIDEVRLVDVDLDAEVIDQAIGTAKQHRGTEAPDRKI